MTTEGRNAALIRRFYDARARRDLEAVRSKLADNVSWREPELGRDHTGDLREAVEQGEQAVAFVDWSSTRDGKELKGKEIAVYREREGRILKATFHPDNPRHDEEFWA